MVVSWIFVWSGMSTFVWSGLSIFQPFGNVYLSAGAQESRRWFCGKFLKFTTKTQKNLYKYTVSTKTHWSRKFSKKKHQRKWNTFWGGARESRECFLVGTHPLRATAGKISQKSACYTLHHKMIIEHCNTLQHTVAHCNTLKHTATHCSTL